MASHNPLPHRIREDVEGLTRDRQPTELMRPRFVGERFEGGNIPHEMLLDISRICDMIIETAKWRFKQRTGRNRLPNGFEESCSLQLTVLEDKSAVAPITLKSQETMFHGLSSPFETDFVEGSNDILASIDSATRPDQIPLPKNILKGFSKIGSRLRNHELIEFAPESRNGKAVLTRDTRRALIKASDLPLRVPIVARESELRGHVSEMDQARLRFELEIWDGTRIKCGFEETRLEAIKKAFNGYTANAKVLVTGVPNFSKTGRMTRIDAITRFEELPKLDVSARLDEFRRLEDGWYNGDGFAPDHKELDWLAHRFGEFYPTDELPTPYVFPTIDGGVNIEWALGEDEASLEIDLSTHQGEWLGPSDDIKDDDMGFVDLDDDNGWGWIVDQIRVFSAQMV